MRTLRACLQGWLHPCALVPALALLASAVEAYEIDTHAAITERAAGMSSVSLEDMLGLEGGLAYPLTLDGTQRRAIQWIQEGSRREDGTGFLDWRFWNHFHNPLLNWNEAGFRLAPPFSFRSGRSSILWGQASDQDWSLAKVRGYYLNALIGPDKAEREAALAKTFEGLGNLMHLVQDASVPAHVRNDPHGMAYNYETWVREVQSRDKARFTGWLDRAGGIMFNPSVWRTASPNPLAPSPIAGLIDMDEYHGDDPVRTAYYTSYGPVYGYAGVGEYASANFFSEYTTTFDPATYPYASFRYPSQAPVIEEKRLSSDNVERKYLRKTYRDRYGDTGDTGYLLAREDFVYDYTAAGPDNPVRRKELSLDSLVYADYATRLIPLAVLYSRELYSHFFLFGGLDFEVRLDPQDETSWQFVVLLTSDFPLAGTFTLYAEDGNETRTPLVTANLTVSPGTPSAPVSFRPDPQAKKYILALSEGTYGSDQGVVAGKVKVAGLPYLFIIQRTAEFTGDPDRTNGSTVDAARSIATSEWTQHPGKQKVTGVFEFPGVDMPGQYIASITPIPAGPEVTLRLNGIDVGQQWSRETGPVLTPLTWEVRIDSTTDDLANLPRYLYVTMTDGNYWSEPLLWWRAAHGMGEGAGVVTPFCGGDPPECQEASGTDTALEIEVFFGDGDQNGSEGRDGPLEGYYPLDAEQTGVSFTPVSGEGGGQVAGFPVKTILQTTSGGDDGHPACPAGSWSTASATIFAMRRTLSTGDTVEVWNKNAARAANSQTTAVRKAQPCAPPRVPAPDPPAMPQPLFRRDYSAYEQELLQRHNITPPEYEIALR